MSGVRNTVKRSFVELYNIYRPKNIDKFTREFIKKYRIDGGYEEELKQLVTE
ncbi:hypothetical protein [Numidum massiliense]|uniref:hypothetical protein n=1 Tax=Numidum massiliense TaxID=1522315 RepID=UPI00164D4D93|nr:hypothetical protein [Numidum massiliense]